MYTFQDGTFAFYTALYGSWANDARVVFRVRADSEPKTRAAEKGIRWFDRIVKATDDEILEWLLGHPEYTWIS